MGSHLIFLEETSEYGQIYSFIKSDVRCQKMRGHAWLGYSRSLKKQKFWTTTATTGKQRRGEMHATY